MPLFDSLLWFQGVEELSRFNQWMITIKAIDMHASNFVYDKLMISKI